MGEIHWLLGVEIKWNQHACTVPLSQKAYIDAICACFHLEDARPTTTPMEARAQLTNPAKDKPSCDYPYKEIIGSLMYATTATRLDITFATSILAQFAQNPTQVHWEATKRVVRYLKTTRDLELTYGTRDMTTMGYSDADHTLQLHWHSISGYAFLIGGGAVVWSSKKQPIIALSMMEAKYISATHAMKEAMWLHTFMGEIIMLPTTATTIHCDNQSAIALSKNGQYHVRTKHIEIRFHFIQEAIEDGTMSLTYCPMQTMTTDLLTKLLNHTKTDKHA